MDDWIGFPSVRGRRAYPYICVGEVESDYELPAELPYNFGRYYTLCEPRPKAGQGLSHNLVKEADISTIGALVLKIIEEMAYKLVASKLAISIANMTENLPLEYGSVLTVALCAENLEGTIFVLVIRAAGIRSFRANGMGEERPNETHALERSFTSQTIELSSISSSSTRPSVGPFRPPHHIHT
jgi:hypothetical protein